MCVQREIGESTHDLPSTRFDLAYGIPPSPSSPCYLLSPTASQRFRLRPRIDEPHICEIEHVTCWAMFHDFNHACMGILGTGEFVGEAVDRWVLPRGENLDGLR